jgi:Uma2 family endonuclease
LADETRQSDTITGRRVPHQKKKLGFLFAPFVFFFVIFVVNLTHVTIGPNRRNIQLMDTDTAIHEVKPSTSPPPPILPLEPGDRLTLSEFERRYDAMPGLKKAELIEGRVYMPSPVRFLSHATPHSEVVACVVVYSAATPGTKYGDNATVRMDADNEPQPDVLLRIDETLGGRSSISEDDYIEGAPELIIEIAASSASYDLDEKLTVYRRNGVREYIVWQVYDSRIDWFVLENEKYVLLQPGEDGVGRSRVFPGLWLDVDAMLKGDMAKVLSVLQKGLASDEHGEFLKRLSVSAKNK